MFLKGDKVMEIDLIEIMESYNEYIEKLPKGCVAIADLIRTDEVTSAVQAISNFTEGLNWIMTVSDLLSKQGGSVVLPIEQLIVFLHEINDGLVAQDYVVIADMFEYEIAPILESISSVKVES